MRNRGHWSCYFCLTCISPLSARSLGSSLGMRPLMHWSHCIGDRQPSIVLLCWSRNFWSRLCICRPWRLRSWHQARWNQWKGDMSHWWGHSPCSKKCTFLLGCCTICSWGWQNHRAHYPEIWTQTSTWHTVYSRIQHSFGHLCFGCSSGILHPSARRNRSTTNSFRTLCYKFCREGWRPRKCHSAENMP